MTILSDIKYGKIRDSNGDLTHFKNGDRFVFVKSPVWPLLPRVARIADIKCKVFHDSQFKPHCLVCNTPGHKIGDETCKARSTQEVIPFRSHHNVLSNFYMCDINVWGKTFRSSEHAYQWKKAMDVGKVMLAEDIRNAEHAGKAKRLSKAIPEDTTAEREAQCLKIMQTIVNAKAAQVPEFRQGLLDTEQSYLAEATFDKFWASGLSSEDTEKIDPKYFPGQNKLGILLMDLRDLLSCKEATPDNNTVSTEDVQKNHRLDPVHSLIGPESMLSTSSMADTPGGSGCQASGEFVETQQVVKPKLISQSKLGESKVSNISLGSKKQQSSPSSKPGVITGIKEMLANQKEKSKRKPSKTPEKEKGTKIQRQTKGLK